MEHIILPRRSYYARTLIKWVLHVIVKTFIFIRHGFKYHTVPTLLVTMLAIGTFFYITDETAALPFVGARGGPIYYPDGRPIAAEQYLLAKQNADAAKAWENYSESFKQRLIAQGLTVEQEQYNMTIARLSGEYGGFEHAYSTELESGETLHVYFLKFTSASGRTSDIPYTFVIGTSGKIERMW
jgi:hypothetical protein